MISQLAPIRGLIGSKFNIESKADMLLDLSVERFQRSEPTCDVSGLS